MIVTVKYPLLSELWLDHCWPIFADRRSYFIHRDAEKRATHVSVRFTGISPDASPRFIPAPSGDRKGTIQDTSWPQRLAAERDLRSWQAMLAPFLAVELDFDTPMMSFEAEDETERNQIGMREFSSSLPKINRAADREFDLYARAFIGLQNAAHLVELMAFYRDGMRSLDAGRSVDAFNSFYLYFETQFCGGRTGIRQSVDSLLTSEVFRQALAKAVKIWPRSGQKRPRFLAGRGFPDEEKKIVEEIVKLRGALRHHSLSSTIRWDPNRPQDYFPEALFLSQVGFHIAFGQTLETVFSEAYDAEIMKQAENSHQAATIRIVIDVRVFQRIEHLVFEMRVPQPNLSAGLAGIVLSHALRLADERAPGGELFAIRAATPSGVELFRYDVGPSIPR